MKIEVARYHSDLRADWEAVLGKAKNGIFLFERDYMEYHADRFPDFSAIAYVDGEAAVLLPASKENSSTTVVSHGGLTFGGFVVPESLRVETVLAVIDQILHHLKTAGATRLNARLIPSFLCSQPSAEVDYALWRRGFAQVRRDVSSVICLKRPLGLSRGKQRDADRARRLNVILRPATIDDFYPILEGVLNERHGAKPVHSYQELALLIERFPNNISLHCAFHDDRPVAGALIYRYDTTWHTQYLATSDEGRRLNALDLVLETCIDEARLAEKDYFSLGTSMLGEEINSGLLWQKESFGARAVLHDIVEGAL